MGFGIIECPFLVKYKLLIPFELKRRKMRILKVSVQISDWTIVYSLGMTIISSLGQPKVSSPSFRISDEQISDWTIVYSLGMTIISSLGQPKVSSPSFRISDEKDHINNQGVGRSSNQVSLTLSRMYFSLCPHKMSFEPNYALFVGTLWSGASDNMEIFEIFWNLCNLKNLILI